MKIKMGSIPEKITLVYPTTQFKLNKYWEHLSSQNSDMLVTNAFPVNTASVTSINTAIEWAKNYNRQYNDKDNEVAKFVIDNKPGIISQIKLLTLEYRGQGGRAWKVLVTIENNEYCLDMREDVLLDSLLNSSSNKGIIKGKFLFGLLGSQIRIVREGSELYKELIASGKMKTVPAIKDFVEGGVYRNRNGKMVVYLGKGNYIQIAEITNWNIKPSVKYTADYVKNRDMWLNVSYGVNDSELSSVEECLEKKGSITIFKPNALKEHLKTITCCDWSIIREKHQKWIEADSNFHDKKRSNCWHSLGLSLHKADEPFIIPIDLEKHFGSLQHLIK